ncbi:flagellar hook-associated protein 2 [Halalkalibacter alkaliphilus]|uniref:Flagellar hook-associated protein 2 n=1 Tax=Halalkalibacter alkaliphilus TaxID=2917993 RepID=A0A9X2A4C6_9BACI|nr:flagellar hook-associated protein 2 [Halalkalibacter alkaliphilus]MCL7746702.1 flagellar hook-associated protein 2 [Halalkalibacter alkaliphilus]
MRLSGFATGMDIQQMVDDLMRAERQPLDRMVQNRELLEWKRDGYREANIEFNKLRDQLFDGVMRNSNMSAKDVTSSNQSLVSATASASANTGTWTISEVSQLATSAYNVSTESITGDGNPSIDPDASIGSQSEYFSDIDGEDGQLTFEIKTFTSNGEESQSFTFDGTATLNEIISEVNSSGIGVSMMYDPVSDRVSITRTETGSFNDNETEAGHFGSEMVFEGNFLTEDLNVKNAYEDEEGQLHTFEEGGENAVFTINGLETERQSNTFTIDGVTFSLHNTFETGAVSLNVSTKVDDVFDTVMSFVDDYNAVLDSMNGKLTEERHRDYRPLTEEQKQAMSEREIEMWEERAQSGMLRNDRIISSGLDRMRMDIYSPVDTVGSFTHISELGITTSSNYMDRGRLEVDQDQLRAAIEADPEAVYQLFAADGESFEEKGIARRMRDSLQATSRQISDQAGSAGAVANHSIGRQIEQKNDRIANFERRLQQIEERYWSQFNAMEAAVQRSNAQAEQLFASLGGGQMM